MTPYYKYLDRTETALRDLDKKVLSIKEGHLIEIFCTGNFSLFEINEKLNELKQAKLQLEAEREVINEYIRGYNKHYYVEKKYYLGLCVGLINRLRHTMKHLGQEFLDSCPSPKNRHLVINEGYLKRSVYDASSFNYPEFKDDIFTLEEQGYNNSAKSLVNEYLLLNKQAEDILKACLGALKQERQMILKHPDQIVFLYEQDVKEICEGEVYSLCLGNLLKNDNQLEEDQLSMKLRLAITPEVGIISCFHDYNLQELSKHKLYLDYNKGISKGFKSVETALWGSRNAAQVKKYRLLMDHLDDLNELLKDSKGNGGKISASILATAMNYCKPFDISNDKKFVNEYMIPIHNSKSRKYQLTQYAAISACTISKQKQEICNEVIDKMLTKLCKLSDSEKLSS